MKWENFDIKHAQQLRTVLESQVGLIKKANNHLESLCMELNRYENPGELIANLMCATHSLGDVIDPLGDAIEMLERGIDTLHPVVEVPMLSQVSDTPF